VVCFRVNFVLCTRSINREREVVVVWPSLAAQSNGAEICSVKLIENQYNLNEKSVFSGLKNF
jgi:hypothetical protein